MRDSEMALQINRAGRTLLLFLLKKQTNTSSSAFVYSDNIYIHHRVNYIMQGFWIKPSCCCRRIFQWRLLAVSLYPDQISQAAMKALAPDNERLNPHVVFGSLWPFSNAGHFELKELKVAGVASRWRLAMYCDHKSCCLCEYNSDLMPLVTFSSGWEETRKGVCREASCGIWEVCYFIF